MPHSLSWTINRQGQFKEQKKDEVCVWVYSLFTDVPGDYVKVSSVNIGMQIIGVRRYW